MTTPETQENQEPSQISDRTLYLNGQIAEVSWFDDDITPQLFKDELMSGDGNITVWINSPGGDCVAAAQIYNMLKEYSGDVTIKIDGLAASAASVIAMAGDKVVMSPVAMMMIHNPSTVAFGDRVDMQKAMAMLDEVKESIINAYEIKTGMSRTKLAHMMDAETWMDAHSALDLGFADEIIGKVDEDIPQAGNMVFSEATVMNSLMDKIAKRCRIQTPEPKEEPKPTNTVKADSLEERLFLMKIWRD
ncbi:Clp protease ClpP [Listeria monocytogenes]|nr:Clp protease ClpP [Listeria monocytogenes]MCD1849286.1 Clp protease ClpP [Listeria monocytogenes]MCD1852227.1 Clp protease ClpP [Listeria monocytogenes]MCD1858088.1 Clp protease ClpP [Listeria monocytogenes]HED6497165.1 Clp protease ClpP [Listeria monocytogenes]